MREWLIAITEPAIAFIDFLALVVVIVSTLEAFVRACRLMFSDPSGHERREVWLRYARWLVAALTFQLAADIIETSVTANWESLGRIAAIAVIRTFLNYFLERDLAEIREREREQSDEQRFRRKEVFAKSRGEP
jgi:uncharacterized membrane protein